MMIFDFLTKPYKKNKKQKREGRNIKLSKNTSQIVVKQEEKNEAMRDSSSSNNREEDRNKDTPSSPPSTLDSRFNPTLRNTQGLLNCRSFRGKVLIMRRLDPLDQSGLFSPNTCTRFSDGDFEHVEQGDNLTEDELQNRSSTNASSSVSYTKSLTMGNETTCKKMQKSIMGAKATDSARLTEELSGMTTILGSWLQWLLQMVIWLSSFTNLLALETQSGPSHFSSASVLASPPKSGIFEPIEISPAVIPHYSLPVGSLPPMYPTYPNTYDPVLTGRCPVNFSAISSIMEKTASDCNQPLAAVVGNVICCPQFSSLLHIFQGFYSTSSDNLVLLNAVADDCFKDIVSILASRGANSSLPTICSTKSSNLTGGSCPVKDITTFEKTVNTSKILEACSIVDPLKECCRPICQPVIMEAALKISGMQSFMNDNKNIVGLSNHGDMINDCKGVVYSWMSRKLPHDAANKAFRILSACKVNRACPLDLKQPSEVIAACRNVAAPSPSCCSSLNSYIAGIQRQMLITNRQAIICATLFGSMLQKGGVMTNVYELCDVDIKDFSLQAYGQQGCLLRSLPADMVYDNSTGFSFTCDLSDNIAAPWPSSSSVTTLSLCAPEMSLPALPTSETLGNPGCRGGGVDLLVLILSLFGLTTLLL